MGADRTGRSGALTGLIDSASFLSANSLAACASLSIFVGGNGGSFAWSSVGARTLRASVFGCEEPFLKERLDMVDIWETSEELDPLRLLNGFVDALRGGKAGEDSEELVRPGRGGGTFRAGSTRLFSEIESEVTVR